MAENYFNFDQFYQDHTAANYLRGITDVLEGDVDELPQRLAAFRERFQIEAPRPEEAPFTFQLAARSYETVPDEARQANANLRRVTFVQGDRFFVSRGWNVGEDQIWDEVASPSSVDIHQESAQLSFLDSEKKIVDWPLTLSNLNRMIRHKPYSDQMMKSCLLRFINHYEPLQTQYLQDRNANEIARFLLSLDSRIDRRAFHRSRLNQSCRNVNESLAAAVLKVKNVVDQLYPLPQPQAPGQAPAAPPGGGGQQAPPGAQGPAQEHAPNSIANRILISAIISFIDDRLAIPMLNRVQQDNHANRLLSYKEYLRLAMNAELRSNVYPTSVLKYGRHLAKFPDVHLHNIQVPRIHPSQDIPRRRSGYYPADLANFFSNSDSSTGYYGQWQPLIPNVLNPPVNNQVVPAVDVLIPNPVQDEQEDIAVPQQMFAPLQPPVPPPRREVQQFDQMLAAQQQALAQQQLGAVPRRLAVEQQQEQQQVIVEDLATDPDVTDEELALLDRTALVADATANLSAPGRPRRALAKVLPRGSTIKDLILWRNKDSQKVEDKRAREALNLAQPATRAKAKQAAGQFRTSTPVDSLMNLNPRVLLAKSFPASAQSLPADSELGPQTRSKARIALKDVPATARAVESSGKVYYIDDAGNRIYVYDPVTKELIADSTESSAREEATTEEETVYEDISLMSALFKNVLKTAVSEAIEQKPSSGNRKPSGDRKRSNSRDKKAAGSSDYKNRNYSPHNRGSRNNSRDRGYSNSNNRNSSNNRSSRRDSRDRRDRRDRSNSYNGRGRNRSSSYDRRGRSPYRTGRRDVSRDRSREARKLQEKNYAASRNYPQMKKGYNCSHNYNPVYHKHCSKCKDGQNQTHHEFECGLYSRWNSDKCSLCKVYNHYSSDCKEMNKFPPRSSQNSNAEFLN